MAAPFPLLSLCLLFCFSAAADTSLQLHRLTNPSASSDSVEHLARLAASSIQRARHIKSPKKNKKTLASSVHAKLFPHSYGGYSVTLGFGSPPQPATLLLDTGSHLTWLPCTRNYACRNCSSPSNPDATLPVFLPKLSASARLLGCRNPKCSYLHPAARLAACSNCSATTSANCSPLCPPYAIIYGSGSTAGVLLSDTLDLPNRPSRNFTFGCSLFSVRQPAGGIAGFGRGAISLPSQLGLKRFSYCLISRHFDDDVSESGSVTLDGVSDAGLLQSTPFAVNPGGNDSVNSVYYYLTLRRITVNGKKVKLPREALTPSTDGDGGVIIDSGTTFTYMEPALMEPLTKAIVTALGGKLNRSVAIEAATGLSPCFISASAAAEVQLPSLALHFKGGAEMRLPVENYFAFATKSTVCMTVVSDGDAASSGGPAAILGSFQQQNYYVVYDLEKGRLRFRQQSCLGT